MNKKLIENLEKEINPLSSTWQEQLTDAMQDFWEYCRPGSVNNWQHPEKPPIQASLALLCRLFKPDRILDLGTGLTGVTFKKYASDAEIICVDDSFIWLAKLWVYLDEIDLDQSGLYWFNDNQFSNIDSFPKDIVVPFVKHPEKIKVQINSTRDGAEHINECQLFVEPAACYVYGDTTDYSPVSDNPIDLVQMTQTMKFSRWSLPDGRQLMMIDPHKKDISDLGKFNFIHYDMGDMHTRSAYLRLAIDMLDRTSDSLIYVDDLHKGEKLYENKSFADVVTETIADRGGIWLNCKSALTVKSGAFGGIAYFPPEVGEE